MKGHHDTEPGLREEHWLEEGRKCETEQIEGRVFQDSLGQSPG